MIDALAIGAPAWVIPALIIGSLLLLELFVAYFRLPQARQLRLACFALKSVAVVLMVGCLIEPLWQTARPQPHENIAAILVDNSRSMRINNPGEQVRRQQELLETLRDDTRWRERLAQNFDVRNYAFDTRLQRVKDYQSLEFEGNSSSLRTVLSTLSGRYHGQPLAGLILFSDGNATDATYPPLDWADGRFPVYPVVEPRRAPLRDLRIDRVTVSQTEFEVAPVSVVLHVRGVGVDGRPLVSRLVDSKGVEIAEQTRAAAPEGEITDFHFRFRPADGGVQFYRASVRLKSEVDLPSDAVSDVEVTLENNERAIAVNPRRGPYRVLYVAGRPNWEFKFLRRALQGDDEVQLVGLVRIARKEPKFTFRDRGVATNNPLFEGFAADDEGEQYDEPVLLRLGLREDDTDELSGGFPKSHDQLFAYDGVILDDVEAAFFSQDQLLMLRNFVSARGGGLLLLGGRESFRDGNYQNTPLADLSPVYIDGPSATAPDEPLRWQFTRDGWFAPWLRLRATEVAEQSRIRDMPAFTTLNQTGTAKPGAIALASMEPSEDGPSALVTQRFGRGRTAALLIGDMWRYAMHRGKDDRRDLQQLWRQMIRWLVADAPRRVELQTDSGSDPSEPSTIHVTARDEEFLPLDNATVDVTVTSQRGAETKLTAVAVGEQAGVYSASYWPREDGGYVARAVVTAADGSQVGQRSHGWVAQPAAAEFARLEPQRELLSDLAAATGGEIVEPDGLNELIDKIRVRSVDSVETQLEPLWHRPAVLLAIIGFLCAEWGLRRCSSLP